MVYPKGHYGIIVNNTAKSVSIFDTDALKAVQTIPMNADVIDVAVARDGNRAAVSSFASKTIFQLELCGCRARVACSAEAATFLEDVALTPDARYALSVDGSAENQDIVCYSLRENKIVSTLPANAQAVAVSPKNNGLVLTAVFDSDSVHRYTLGRGGELVDSGQEFAAGPQPINVNFSRDGNFAFISNYGLGVSVLSTVFPDSISLISTVGTTQSLSMAISRDGTRLFVLGQELVSIYTFDPIVGYLSFARSFEHGLQVSSFYGVDQIALDDDETRLFISTYNEVAVFTTFGVRLGAVEGVSGPGGLAMIPC